MKIKINGRELDLDESKLNPEALEKAKKMCSGGEYAKGGDVFNHQTNDSPNPKLGQVPQGDRFPGATRKPQHFDVGGAPVGETPDESYPKDQPSQAPIINNHYYMSPQMPQQPPQQQQDQAPVVQSVGANSGVSQSAPPVQQVPQQQAQLPPPDLTQQAQAANNQENRALKNIGAGNVAQNASEVQALDAQQKMLQDQAQREEQLGNKYHQDWDNVANQMNPNIDPNHFWTSQSTPSKLVSAIGFMIAGAGMGLAGHPEAGRQAIDNAINRDIDAQKATYNNQGNILRAYTEHYNNQLAGENALRLQYGAQTENLIKRAAAQNGSSTAMDQANLLIAQNRQKLVGNMAELAKQQAMKSAYDRYNAANQPVGVKSGSAQAPPPAAAAPQQQGNNQEVPTPQVDYGKLNNLQQQAALGLPGGMSKEEVQDATKEAASFEQTQQALKDTKDVFAQASKDVSPSSWIERHVQVNPHAIAGITGPIGGWMAAPAAAAAATPETGGLGTVPAWIAAKLAGTAAGTAIGEGAGNLINAGAKMAGQTESAKKYNSDVDAYMVKLEKALAGRASPAMIALVRSSMPEYRDDPATVAQKLANVERVIKESGAYPTLERRGLLK